MAPLKGRHEPGVEAHSLHFSIPQETSSLRYLSRMTEENGWTRVTNKEDRDAPLTTFPLAVFLKNFRCVKTASSLFLLRMVISTMTVGANV